MGLLKKIFGGIFGLIGGIFKIFGFGKKGEYFLELEEDVQTSNLASTSAAPSASNSNAVATGSFEKTKTGPNADQAVVKAVQSAVIAEKKADQPQTEPPKSVQQLQQANFKQEESPQMPTVTNFATDYLVNPKFNRSARRRPGPSIATFKEMARDMNRKSA
ncbi:MAG: hypothetical protein ACFBSG_02970 [Leptolyngbyaceae cyanobacterium]